MSNAKRTLAIFGRRAVVVALSTLTIFSGVPTAALAEVQEEVSAALEQSAADVEAQDTSADSAPEDTQAEQPAAEESNQDTSSEESGSNSGSDSSSSDEAASSEQQAAPAATEADIALSGLDHATIKRADGQTIALPSTKVTVSTSDDFKFAVEPDTDYSLKSVKLTVSGVERELTADANNYYTIPAADIASGSSLKLETEAADNSNSSASNEATSITEADGSEEGSDDESLINSIALVDYVEGDWSVDGNDTLEVGKFAVYTANDFSGAVTWSTSDESVATVESNGVVTAVAAGEVDVIATYGNETASKTITVTEAASTRSSGYSATITPTVENAEVAYFAWHDESDTSNIAFTKVSGTVTISDYTTWNKPGYVVFLVKPNSNHIVTGLGASGNGDIYAVDATSWGNISSYPNMAKVMAAAKAAGYVATFGWYRGARSTLSANFTISAKSPDMTVAAVSDRTAGVVSGDELTFTVTITPKTTGSGKDSVTGVKVNSADVNGTEVEVENLAGNSDGTFTGTVHYTATDDDCTRGSVVLTVNATSTYSGAYTITSGDLASSATVTKTATCTCQIAPESQVKYAFVSGTSGMDLPGAINAFLPSDNSSYAGGKTVKAKDPSKKEYIDAQNDGYWTFTGWDNDSVKTKRSGETVTFTGTWTFTKYSKYTIKYVDESGAEIAEPVTVSGNKVKDKIKISDVAKPTIAGYSYTKASPPSSLTITNDDSKNVITLTYKVKAGKAGYYLVLGDATWSAPSDTTKEADAQKWYYNYGFTKGDTFVVTDSKPSAANRVFIGWMDKARDDQAAAIRKAGDKVTYCYSNDQTYTLDALWASLSATGEDVTYDGKSHTVTVDVNINEGTGLDPKYAEQAKELITTDDVEYSTDGGATWSKDKPSFKDAGTYAVKVRQDVTVGGQTTTLTAEAQVKIAQKEYWVETSTASKKYDGAELVGTATVKGLIDGESATATATTIGSDVTASTENKVAGEIVWADNTNANNYKRGTDSLGTLEITKRSIKLTSASDEKAYDGTALTNSNVTVSGDGFVSGEGATYTVTGSQTAVGSSDNEFSYTLNSDTKAGNYEIATEKGTLKVTDRKDDEKFEITVEGNSTTVTYDGREHEASGITEASRSFTNEAGAVFTITADTTDPSSTDVTTRDNKVSNVKVTDANGNDVTEQFKVTTVDGKLTINKKAATITAGSAEKEYDGTALTTDKFTTDGFVEGQGIESVTIEGSQTLVGSSESSVKDNSWKAKDGTKLSNYEITTVKGALTVKDRTAKYQITLEGITASKTYNGSDQTMWGVKTDEFTFNGETFTVKNYKSDVTGHDAGDYTQNITSTNEDGHWTVVDSKSNDVSAQFSVSTTPGKLTIAPKDVTITSKDASKAYDGSALTKHEASVTEGGFVEGEEAGVSYTNFASRTDAGTSDNTFDVVFDGTNAKAGNYNVTKKNGTLTVDAVTDKVTVTITEHGGTFTYDGDEHTATGYDVSSDNTLYTADDFAFSGNASVSGTDAGTYEMQLKASDFTNTSKNFTNVEFVIVDGTLTINKRSVELTSATDQKVYDGSALTNERVTLTDGSFAKSDSFTATASGTITDAGSVANEFTYELTGDGAKKDDEGNYVNYTVTTKTGTLTVAPVTDKVTVTIMGNKTSDTYDGTEKSASGYTVSIDNTLYAESDFTYTGSSEAKATNAGTYAMGLKDGNFENKSKNFTNVEFVVTDGELAIAKREVTLKSATLRKQYDGTALTNGEAALEVETGWASGEGATYAFTGSQTVVGSTPNVFSYTLNEGTNADNYNIAKTEGNLIVTNREAKYEITVRANSDTVTYDGKEHSVSGIETDEFVVDGRKYTVSGLKTDDPKQTDAGTYANNISGTAVVKDENGNDVSSEFEVATENGSLVIEKATVTLKSADLSKTYDGTALTNGDTALATETGWAEGEGASYTFTGSQTNAGESKNTFSYTLNANTKAGNYNTIVPEYGTLKVNPVSDKVTVTITENSDSKVYNGTEQSVEGYTFKASDSLYTESCFSFVGDADHKVAKGTFVGQYPMELEATDFKNTSGNFTNVEFVIEDGQLEITPAGIEADDANWTKQDVEKFYDGTALTAYVASAKGPYNDDLEVEYSTDNKNWTSNPAEISLTHAGSVTVYLRARTSNYTEGKYAYDSETITVKPRSVTLTSGTKSKVYDGTALTDSTVTATDRDDAKGEGFVGDEGATYNVTGTITNAGSVDNEFTYELKSNTQAGDYVITPKYGKLIVTADANEVVVTVKGKSEAVTYDGNEHTVEGYEVVSITGGNGNFTENDVALAEGHDATVSGTDVLVNNSGAVVSYEDKLSADDFVSTNSNFSNVKFVIDSSAPSVSLTINKRDVTLTSESGTWPYDGESHSKPEVVSSDELFSSQVSDLKATGSVMHAVDGEVENAITYTAGESFKETNYNITKNEGKLTVTERAISPDEVHWSTTDVVKTYDGTTYTAGVATATDAYGQELQVEYSVDGKNWYSNSSDIKATNVSESVTVQLRAKSGDYSNYATETEQLTINPATLTVTTPDKEKVYDGEALTAAGTITGFVNGETAKFETTGSQTYVGESANTYNIDWDSSETTAKQGNYTVAAAVGMLVVTAPTDNGKVVTKSHAAGTYALGKTVTFTIRATNVYDTVKTMTLEELEGVTLSQSVFENVQPGETVTATATYTITEDDILRGNFVNTVTVKFSDEDKSYDNTDEVDVDKANAHLTVEKTTTSTPANGSTYALGEQITYDVKVTNDGNLTATDVVVEDQLTGAILADGQSAEVGTLAPGASATVKYVYTVTEADILAGKVTNNATASGKTDGGDPTVTPGKSEDETDPKNGHITVKKTTMSDPADGYAYKLGETIEYEIVVKNDGNLTVTDIKVTDPNADDFGEQTIDSLAPGESKTFTATHVVTEADLKAGKVVNVATAEGTSPDPDKPEVPVVPGKDTDSTETAKAALTVVKTAEQNGSAADGAFKLGETINYTITVTNTGNQTVKDIKVVDPVADNFGEQTVDSLAPKQSATFTATHVVTEADILAGSVLNKATAKGVDSDGRTIADTGEDTKNVDALNTTLTVKKTASKPADGKSYKLGETVTYTITVTNDGNVTYKNVKVADAKTGLNEIIPSLGVGESKTYTTTHVISEEDIAAGSYANEATATADPVVDPKTDTPVTPSGKDTETIGGDEGEDPIDEGKADLVVSKKVTNEGKGSGENGAFQLGDVIEYEITVTNEGNLTAMDFQVTDENADNFTPVTIKSLAPGETTTAIKASHKVTSDDILNGKVVNVATTSGGKTVDPKVDPKPTPGEVDTDVDGIDTTLVVTKVAASPVDGKAYKLGEAVTYTITVTNKGNVPYTNVEVSDAQTGFSAIIDKLDVNETRTFTTTHKVTETDIVSGSYTNTATATADPITDPKTGEDVTPSGTGSATIGGDKGEKPIDEADPKLVITKTSDVAAGHLLKEGETVNYTVTVTNTGNLTLTNVKVDDQLAGATLADGESATIESLAPNASQSLHYSYVVKQSDVVAGSVKNHATATADNPSDKKTDVTPGDEEDPTEKAEPSISVIKKADKTSGVTADDVISYTITVTNNGNVDLHDVKVTDELTGYEKTIGYLAKGKYAVLTTTYTVTEADMVAGFVKNVAEATSKDPKNNEVNNSGETTSTTEAISAKLKVEKSAAAGTYAAGDKITYTIKVTNTGNVSVSNVKVVDEKTGLSKTVTLAKDESVSYDTTYTVTDADIKAGKLENTATADGTDPAKNPVHGEDTNTIDDSKQPDPDNPDKPTLKREMNVSEIADTVYNGTSQELKPTVTDKYGNTLVEGTDYTVTYSSDTTNVGTVTATITGKDNYTGKFTRTYKITPATLTVVTPDATKVYDGEELTAEGSYSGLVNGETIGFATTGAQTEAGSSANTYEIEWASDGFFGLVGGNEYTAKKSNYTVSDTIGTLTVTAQSIDPGTDPENPDPSYKGVSIDEPSDVTYDATEHKWAPVVTDKDGNVLVEGKDYTVTYGTDDFTNVTGLITVTITGMGSYTGTVVRTYQITPAELTVTTGSDSKTYDGTALTNNELRIEGLKGNDYVTAATTGSQTEVGSSTNTYSLVWSGALESNYRIVSENLGTLTVAEAPAPTPNPTPAPTPDNGGNTPTNGGSVVDVIADALEDGAVALTGEEPGSETIYDAENPLGREQKGTCWVHFYLIVGMVVTAIYGVCVLVRRRRFSNALEDELNNVLSADKEGSDE